MKKLHTLALCALAFVGLLAPHALAAEDQAPVVGMTGIAPYHVSNYIHAKEVLNSQYPEFFTQFNTLAANISNVQSTDEEGQYKALMDFFPAIEKMLEVKPSISTDVVVSYFTVALETADEVTTTVDGLLFNAFKEYIAGGDAMAILSEQALMKKHHISREEAQHIRTVVHKLYPTSALQ